MLNPLGRRDSAAGDTHNGPEHDTWEPYKNLAHTEQLILYLIRNRMRSLIPKGH